MDPVTYDGSLPPEDGREYWWSNVADAWIPADPIDDPAIDNPFKNPGLPLLALDDYHHQEP